MRLALECHSWVQCFDEIRAYSLLAGSVASQQYSKPILAFKIPRWTEQLDSPLLWDLGLPQQARSIYSGQKILFMVRDVRDTVASMLKLQTGSKSWLEHHGIPILKAKAAQDARFASRYRTELEAIEHARYPSISAAALYWKYKTEALLDFFEKGYPVLPIYYEDLTAQPELQLRETCEFLGIPWEDQLLNHPAVLHSELFRNGLTVGNTDPKRAIDCTCVGQWWQFLSAEQVAEIDAIVQTTPRDLASAIREAGDKAA